METASFAKIVEQHVRKALKAERGNGEFVDNSQVLMGHTVSFIKFGNTLQITCTVIRNSVANFKF